MNQYQVMTITVLFIIVLFSVGLRANSDAKVIQDEMKVCEQDDVTLSCGAASSDNRWKIRAIGSYGLRTKVPKIPSKYGFINTSLIIKDIQPKDTKKQYICSTKSPIHHFRITYVYTLKLVCKDIVAYEGSKLNLKCNVNIPDDELGKIVWKYRYKHLRKSLRSDDRTSIVGKMLNITDVAMRDSGTFTCIAARKAVHRSRETFFYNLLVEKPPQTTSAATTTAPATTTVLPTTASTTKIPSTKTAEATSGKTSTTLPPFPTFSTTESTVSKGVSTDGTTTQELKTVTVKPIVTEHRKTEKVPTVKPDENAITEILPVTLNPKHRARTTQSNAIDSGNDNQLGGKAQTTPQSSSSIITISWTTLVWLCVVAMLPFYLT